MRFSLKFNEKRTLRNPSFFSIIQNYFPNIEDPNENIFASCGKTYSRACAYSWIKKHYESFGHYHTGGVPGRNEIDDTQEIYYPAVMKAIVETGYKGFVAQEFIPKRDDKIASLKQGVQICDV